MYDAVKKMQGVPLGKGVVLKVLVPMALPMIVVAALQVPLKEILLKLMKTLL